MNPEKAEEIIKEASSAMKIVGEKLGEALKPAFEVIQGIGNEIHKALIERYIELDKKIESDIANFRTKYALMPNVIFLPEEEYLFLKYYINYQGNNKALYETVIDEKVTYRGLKVIIKDNLKKEEIFVALM